MEDLLSRHPHKYPHMPNWCPSSGSSVAGLGERGRSPAVSILPDAAVGDSSEHFRAGEVPAALHRVGLGERSRDGLGRHASKLGRRRHRHGRREGAHRRAFFRPNTMPGGGPGGWTGEAQSAIAMTTNCNAKRLDISRTPMPRRRRQHAAPHHAA